MVRRGSTVLLAAVLLAACSRNDGRTLTPPPRSDQTLSIATSTTGVSPTASVDSSSDAAVDDGSDTGSAATLLAPWVNGEVIPDTYTCRGANQAPSLVWRGVTPGAVEQALVMTDANAGNFVHWLVTGIPPDVTNLDPGHLPAGAIVGLNSSGASGYTGPCPPSGLHTYYVTLYELPTASGVTASTPAAAALASIEAAQSESVSVAGTVGS